jgi:hypothetical protein
LKIFEDTHPVNPSDFIPSPDLFQPIAFRQNMNGGWKICCIRCCASKNDVPIYSSKGLGKLRFRLKTHYQQLHTAHAKEVDRIAPILIVFERNYKGMRKDLHERRENSVVVSAGKEDIRKGNASKKEDDAEVSDTVWVDVDEDECNEYEGKQNDDGSHGSENDSDDDEKRDSARMSVDGDNDDDGKFVHIKA